MPRVCTICTHPQRPAIDRALLAREPFRNIAGRFGTSTAALTRHKKEHLPGHVAKAQHAKEVALADDLLEQLRRLRGKAISLLLEAERSGDLRTALAGVREARACIELLLEVEGELDRRNVTNISISAKWIELRSVIVAALAPYPEARQRLSAALKAVEGGAT